MRDLKTLRKEKGLTQKEAAAKMGIARSYYNAIENGTRKKNMDVATMEKISEAFEIDIEEVLHMAIA